MTEANQVEKVRANIVQVLRLSPGGVKLSDLSLRYFEVVGSELNYLELGFETVETVLKVLTVDIVQLDYDVDDVLVSLIPGQARASIPVQELPQEDLLEVVVGEVVHPLKFYIQLASQYDMLNQLMDQLDTFYTDYKSSELSLVDCEVVEGDLLAVPWTDNMWYRGIVKGVKDLTTLKVFYLDYGSMADVKKSSVRHLASQFRCIPAQAVLAKLSGLVPVGRKWSGGSSARILELTRNSHEQALQAIIRDREGDKLALWLIDGSGVGINETLVEEGLAKYDPEDSHLQESLKHGRNLEDERSNLVREVMHLQKEILELSGGEEGKIDLLLRRALACEGRINQLEEAVEPSVSLLVVETHPVVTDWGSAVQLHVVRVGGECWVSGTELSGLVKEWRGWDLMERRLKSRNLMLDELVVDRKNEKWDKLVEGEVVGLKDAKGNWKEEVKFYKLNSIPAVFSGFEKERCSVTASSLTNLGKRLAG